MNRYLEITSLLVASFAMTGFFGDFFIKNDEVENANAYMAQIKARAKPSAKIGAAQVKKLSVYTPYVPPEGITDPFIIKNFVSLVGATIPTKNAEEYCKVNNCGDGPPTPHIPYFLERYQLDQLTMVGTLSDKKSGREALIKTPDSGVVHARVGEYIGMQNGLILKITPSEMIIREKLRSADGWKDHMEQIKLSK